MARSRSRIRNNWPPSREKSRISRGCYPAAICRRRFRRCGRCRPSSTPLSSLPLPLREMGCYAALTFCTKRFRSLDATQDADRFLITAVRKGDERAWHQLIDRYQGRLLAFARARLRQPGEAEDALQETLLGFLTSLKHYD